MRKQQTTPFQPVEDLDGWRRELTGLTPEETIGWALSRWKDRLAIFTSFQADGMVLVDLVCRLRLPISILTLDTGRLPEETYDHWDRIRDHYSVEIEAVLPDSDELHTLLKERGPNSFRHDPQSRLDCCRVRKVNPFQREVQRFDAWLSGLRRDQSDSRRSITVVDPDLGNAPQGGLYKVSPLVQWTLDDVWRYLRDHDVPTHPLYEKGYHSIGCAPCSRPLRPAEDARSTRWWWEGAAHRECGLHPVANSERPS